MSRTRRKRRSTWIVLLNAIVLLVACGTPAKQAAQPSATPPSQEGSATEVALAAPEDVAFDASGVLYISEFEGNRIDRIDDASELQVVAGTGSSGFAGDGGPATEATLTYPIGLTFDADGNLYVADEDGWVRVITPDGIIETFAPPPA